MVAFHAESETPTAGLKAAARCAECADALGTASSSFSGCCRHDVRACCSATLGGKLEEARGRRDASCSRAASCASRSALNSV
eukprot:4718138-Prymnesium_polylepis.2